MQADLVLHTAKGTCSLPSPFLPVSRGSASTDGGPQGPRQAPPGRALSDATVAKVAFVLAILYAASVLRRPQAWRPPRPTALSAL
jgi:hypothetical protein